MEGDAIDQARQVIETRLAELKKEAARLETALRDLGKTRPRGGSAGTSKRTPARRREPRRAEQFKRVLARNPGAAVSEIAKKIGISSQQGHGIAKRLREKGEIKKQGHGYAVKT